MSGVSVTELIVVVVLTSRMRLVDRVAIVDKRDASVIKRSNASTFEIK